jgi:hypothetical protein
VRNSKITIQERINLMSIPDISLMITYTGEREIKGTPQIIIRPKITIKGETLKKRATAWNMRFK